MNVDGVELSRYRRALTFARPADRESCPEPERIWQAVGNELDRRQVAAMVDHTLVCGDCSLAWQLAVELGRPNAESAARSEAPARSPRSPFWNPLLAVAAVVLLAVAVPWGLRQETGEQVFRAAGSEEVLATSSERPLSRDDCLLRWSSPWPDATYSVRVMDAGFDEILAEESGLTKSEFLVPSERLANQPPGATIVWSVEATHPDGRTLSQSFDSTLR